MRITLAATAAALLLLPAAAGAQTYPEPKEPGKIAPKPKGPFETHTVCKKRASATSGASRRRSTRRRPATRSPCARASTGVRHDQRRARSATCASSATASTRAASCSRARNKKQNGFFVNGADEVTIDGFMARNYKANGFFVVNDVGYTLTHLVAAKTGVYGVYAFNSKGGEMSHSEAYYHSDAGFYIGQTPQQAKPVRSVVRDVESWGNPIGFSATNMRYVTITSSRFYNNAHRDRPERARVGEVPARRGERDHRQRRVLEQLQRPRGRAVQAQEDAASCRWCRSGPASCCSAAATNRVEDNRVYGNYLSASRRSRASCSTRPPRRAR